MFGLSLSAILTLLLIPPLLSVFLRAPKAKDVVSLQEDEQRLQEALSQLSQDDQQVITLRHREHLTFPQIASHMNRSEDAVRMLWQRAIRRLTVVMETGRDKQA